MPSLIVRPSEIRKHWFYNYVDLEDQRVVYKKQERESTMNLLQH